MKTYFWEVGDLLFLSQVDHNDPSKPSHRLTNGPEPLKPIESRQKTFNGDGFAPNSKIGQGGVNPIQGFMEKLMHSVPSVKNVLGVLEWSYVS